jgi:hypothetical protein
MERDSENRKLSEVSGQCPTILEKAHEISCENLFKGTEARDFLPLVFFMKLTPYEPLIHTLKYFRIRFRIHGDIRIRR